MRKTDIENRTFNSSCGEMKNYLLLMDKNSVDVKFVQILMPYQKNIIKKTV